MGGWMRVGILCTALWTIATFSYAAWHYFYERNVYPRTVLETCTQYALNASRCDALLAQTQEEWKRIPFDWTRPAVFAFGPLPFCWALGWILIAQRGRKGFR